MGTQMDDREELDRTAEIVSGDIYLQMDEKAEAGMADMLARAVRTRKGKIVLQEGAATPLDQVRAVLIREGAVQRSFVSNASTREPRGCREQRYCPLSEAQHSCVLRRRSCSSVIIRPACDTPALQAMFPDDEILGLKAWVWDCPHRPQGSLLSVIGFVWLPKCEQRPYEVAVEGRLFLNNEGGNAFRRPGNALRAPLFERLDPVSLRTREKLRDWSDYLEWRSHLLMATKVGIRFLAARIDVPRRNLVFTVIAESCEAFNANRFWERHEPVYACGRDNSNDAWIYRERTFDECKAAHVKKDYGVELGDYERTTPRDDIRRSFSEVHSDCPWRQPYFADVSFAVDGDLVEKMENELGRSAAPDEVSEFLQHHLKLPKDGFLTLSSVGDEVLISRQRRAIQDFGEMGSNSAPFLSTYLFDISKARVPEKVELPEEFRNQLLNDNQKQAVATILAAPDVALVQGPPGTGKTTVIAEALWQLVKEGKRVLMVSQSGAAVDNALDRLANVPEIRAIRLQKERRNADGPDEGSRYSKANALANFYQTLGDTPRRRLAEWEAQDVRLKELADFRSRLANLADRLDAEDRFAAANDEEFRRTLESVEAAALPVLRAFESLGLKVFVPAYNPDWPLAQRREALKAALQAVQGCERDCLVRLKDDIVRLKGLPGETVMSDADALRVASLRQEAAELQRQMENEPDDAAYDRLSHRHRDLQREIRSVIAAASFDNDVYKRHFQWPIADAQHGRTEILSVLEPLQERLGKLLDEMTATGLRRLEGLLLGLEERIAETRKRRAPFAAQADELLVAAREKFGMPSGTVASSLGWCDAERTRVQATLDETKAERALLEPLYRGWLERLEKPTDSDADRVLPEYVKSCSIVGVTCTSDNRILEQNGFGHFDVVLIDEVSKATPPELLMCMTLAEKAVLVGDHRQLPPLFGDREPLAMEEIMERDEEEGVEESRRVTRANFRKYERMVGASLFKEYFEQAPEAIKCTLWEQYRMHPDVMRLVNDFYDGRLTCGLADPDRVRDHLLGPGVIPWMRSGGHAFWIDSTRDPDGRVFEEEQSGSSKVNRLEVALAVKALKDIDAGLERQAKALGRDIRKTAGVIAFYGHQKRLLRRAVQGLDLKHLSCRVDTVDRFQGQERDYVLVSMTRNKARHYCGTQSSNAYVAKFERINVAFSRARELLLVFGAADMFRDYNVSLPPLLTAGPAKSQPVYRRMIEDLAAHGRLVGTGNLLSSAEWRVSATKSRNNQPFNRKRRFA